MKSFVKKYAHVVAAFALTVATIAANSTCTWLTYQPVMPECAKKLRKF